MKAMKKFTTIMLTICLLVACFSMSAFAADGKIMFTDPQTKTGETFEVTGVVQKSAGNFGKIEITMKYDTEMLKFTSGDGITETEAGKLTYKGDATHDAGPRKEFKFSFTALKEGTTKIEITNATVKNVSGTVLDYTKGSSTVTIAKGEGTTTTPTTSTTVTTTDAIVEVNGISYKIANEFPEDVIPAGYEAAKLEYDLVEYDVVYSEEFGLYLAYLVNEENAGDFFMYVEADATFAPYEEIKVSDSVTIALLSDASDVVLPEEYKPTTVVLNEHDFPAWQTENANGFCILYAINNQGEKSLY
ncbi:MAG: cohesin domain-containing protein, partial [Parabacteroides sp.]|nr:cohesin domain-containing protein [Parabacteroides sp.]